MILVLLRFNATAILTWFEFSHLLRQLKVMTGSSSTRRFCCAQVLNIVGILVQLNIAQECVSKQKSNLETFSMLNESFQMVSAGQGEIL